MATRGSHARAKRRPIWIAAGIVLVALLGLELALRRAIGNDGMFRGRPLPPFGAITHPSQRAWLERERLAIEAESSGGSTVELDTGPGCFDAELGWCVRTPYLSPDETISVNACGSRGRREYAETPLPSVTRIECFGESFTWCDEVPDAAAWPRQMEHRRPDLEALNFGVSGYGTDQALLRFQRDGAKLAPEVVLIGLMFENLGRNTNRYRPLWYPGSTVCVAKPRFFLRDGQLELVPQPFATRAELVSAVADGRVVELLREHEGWSGPSLGLLESSAIARIAAGWLGRRERAVEHLWRDADGEPYRVTLAILERFANEARAAGAERVCVLLVPREEDVRAFAVDGVHYWGRLADDLRARGIDSHDLAPALARAALRTGDTKKLYVRGHWTAQANAAVAESVLDWVGHGAAR